MCGVAGIVGPSESSLLDPITVGSMVAAMRHRGPDDDGLYASASGGGANRVAAVLGACRLAILDLSSSGHQPLIDTSRNVAIVFNGEIYNFRDLRENLIRRGVEFRSHSDTEVVLQLYLRHGPAAMLLLEGMFAFAIWDPREESVFLARDRLGVKPLYLAERQGCLLFASELRVLLATGLIDRAVSPEGVASYLRFGAVREPHTIIEGIKELPAGTWLNWSPRARATGRYWSLEPVRQVGGNGTAIRSGRKEAAERVRELFLEGVRLRLTSDVPVVTFLSGGVDSTSVVAGVRIATGAGPDTIGVTFDESRYSEEAYVDAVVRHYSCRHHDRRLTAEELLALVPEALRAMDQPTFDGINTYVVSRAASELGFKVALSGIGGDELFGGYSSFRFAPLLARTKRLSQLAPLGRLAAAAALVIRGQRGKKLSRWFRGKDIEGDEYDLVREVFSRSERERLLDTAPGVELATQGGLEALSFGDISRRELTEYLRNVLLRDTDCFGMACSLEVREPFLYTPLVEQVLGIPDAWKVRGRGSKPLLVEALSDLLPQGIRTRAKHGFVLPFDMWLRSGALRKDVESTLARGVGEHERLLGTAETKIVWEEFARRRTSWNRVWALYVLQKWVDLNIAGA